MVVRSYRPQRITSWILDNKKLIKIKDMTKEYIENCLDMLGRYHRIKITADIIFDRALNEVGVNAETILNVNNSNTAMNINWIEGYIIAFNDELRKRRKGGK